MAPFRSMMPKGLAVIQGAGTHTRVPIIYTSEHYSTALLEKLVHANLVMPANQHYIAITIPNGIS